MSTTWIQQLPIVRQVLSLCLHPLACPLSHPCFQEVSSKFQACVTSSAHTSVWISKNMGVFLHSHQFLSCLPKVAVILSCYLRPSPYVRFPNCLKTAFWQLAHSDWDQLSKGPCQAWHCICVFCLMTLSCWKQHPHFFLRSVALLIGYHFLDDSTFFSCHLAPPILHFWSGSAFSKAFLDSGLTIFFYLKDYFFSGLLKYHWQNYKIYKSHFMVPPSS